MGQDSHRAESAKKAEEVHEEHQANVNQVRHEPIPASHHDDNDGQDSGDSDGASAADDS
jgi:hypothetical protein